MFWERFKLLLQEKNLKQTDIAKACNIKDGTISAWKRGFIPQKETLKILSKYLNVSIDYLLGYTDIKLKNEEKQIDEEEKQILENYNKASEDTKTAIKRILNLA